MSVIAYDKPVKDFIAGLNATGHVTNIAYRKTSVTFHHNGGRLSLQGILEVWKTRPASAHFQVDGAGALGQYVKINEYAWATGNTQGNKESISIELANATLAPRWEVAEVTWKEGARLAGWIFARVIGVRPDRSNVHVHHDWKATLCAGPFIDSILGTLVAECQKWYDHFVGSAPAPQPTPAPSPGKKTFEQVVNEVIAGQWGNGSERLRRLRSAGYDPSVVQAEVNRRLLGKASSPAPRPNLNSVVDEVIAGKWGNNPERANRLRAAGHNPAQIQAMVNAKLSGGSAPAVAARKSVAQIVNEVIAGQWGNNPERGRRLTAAGYNSAEIQNAVNARLGGQTVTRPSVSLVAQQVIAGQWGNGNERRRRLTAAGYDYSSVQAEVNRLLR